MRYIRPTSDKFEVLIPIIAIKLEQAGITRQTWNQDLCLEILKQSSNYKNLAFCFMKNQKAIFEGLKW
jgi:hypothetical protein